MKSRTRVPAWRRALMLLTSTFAFLAAGWCYGAITGITVTGAPGCIGQAITLKALEDGKTPGTAGSFFWEQRCIEDGCAKNWIVINGATGQSTAITSFEKGTREFRVTRTYFAPSGITESKKETTATWTAPSSIALTLGDQTPVANCPAVPLRLEFTLSCLPGSQIAGLIEERIWRAGDDSGWVPAGSNLFYENGVIVDNKNLCVSPPGAWAIVPVGTFDTFDQQLRLKVPDCCNQNGAPIEFPKKRFQKQKLLSGQWQVKFITDL